MSQVPDFLPAELPPGGRAELPGAPAVFDPAPENPAAVPIPIPPALLERVLADLPRLPPGAVAVTYCRPPGGGIGKGFTFELVPDAAGLPAVLCTPCYAGEGGPVPTPAGLRPPPPAYSVPALLFLVRALDFLARQA